MKHTLDWSNLPYGYINTDRRYVSMWSQGAWDEGALVKDKTLPSARGLPAFIMPSSALKA